MAYSAGDVLIQAVMHAASGLVSDQIVNDFAFHYPVVQTPAQLLVLMALVDNFYNADQVNGHHVSEYISNQVSRAATHELKAYKIQAGPLGSPLLSSPWLGPRAASGNFGVPTECAGVLSFHADMTGAVELGPVSATIPSSESAIDQGAPAVHSGITRPKSRRRGRIYIGPLQETAIDESAPPYPLAPNFTSTMRQAAVALMDAARIPPGDLTVGWSVWSRRDQVVRPVVGGWTDNAPDIQRGRGFKATLRNVWGA